MHRVNRRSPRRKADSGLLQPSPVASGGARQTAHSFYGHGKTCRYNEPAGVFARTSSALRYRRFTSAALALQHVNEELSPRQLLSCTMEVGDARYTGEDLRSLYLAPLYPLARPAGNSR